MANTIEQFHFILQGGGPSPADELDLGPMVRICLRRWSVEGSEAPVISADLMTEKEIDLHVGQLIADLEAVREAAKLELRKALQP